VTDWSAHDRQISPPDLAGLATSPQRVAPGSGGRMAPPASAPASSGGGGGTYMAMPRLMGQPAYARPPRPVSEITPRPFDPDDLPLEVLRSDEEWQEAERASRAWRQREAAADARGRAMRPSGGGGLRGIAARLLRNGA
jgi:hypothetical protein